MEGVEGVGTGDRRAERGTARRGLAWHGFAGKEFCVCRQMASTPPPHTCPMTLSEPRGRGGAGGQSPQLTASLNSPLVNLVTMAVLPTPPCPMSTTLHEQTRIHACSGTPTARGGGRDTLPKPPRAPAELQP